MNRKSIYLFYFSLLIAFLLLTGRLFWLTTIKGNYYRQLAEENRIRIIKKPAPRGIIYDRKGRILARNIPIFEHRISNIEYRILTREEALKLEAEEKEAEIETTIGREYPYGQALAHVIGYLGEVTKEEVESGKWEVGSQKGKTGVEEQYDSFLRGVDGGELVEVDTSGKILKKIGEKEAVPGQNLTLSIDAELQKVAFEALESQNGAVVASDPKTGEISALVSSPSFEPDIFEVQRYPREAGSRSAGKGSKVQSEISKLLTDQNQPLFNRAISGVYPPGSTFKIITAVAGLEEGKIDKNFEMDDPGVILVGSYKYANWYFTQYGRKEGLVDIIKAIQRSTDTFFYKVGELVGIEALEKWAKKFGLGQTLGIDLAGEAAGLVPGPVWKEKVKDEPWFLGNTYHWSIGQGDVLTTPLQVNAWTAVIANGGRLCQPHLAKISNFQFPISEQIQDTKYKIQDTSCNDLGLNPQTLFLIKEGMKKACEPGGTGWPLFDFSPAVACKTGTAEYGDPKGRTHAWITLFAPTYAKAAAGKPTEQPEIALTVLVEGGGEGSSVAGPIAKKILEEWFER